MVRRSGLLLFIRKVLGIHCTRWNEPAAGSHRVKAHEALRAPNFKFQPAPEYPFWRLGYYFSGVAIPQILLAVLV